MGLSGTNSKIMAEFEKLFEKTKNYILSLDKRTCLSSFYIGKTRDIDMRHLNHQIEGYYKSVEIAHSDSVYKIDEAERYLIQEFKRKQIPVIFDNDNNGGAGNPNANKLYVSLRFKVKSVDELEDIDEDNFVFDSVKL